jgi:hypothetical protein
MAKPTKQKARKAAKRKVNWYEKGRKDALTYWHNMDTGQPEEGEHIGGYLAVLCETADDEFESRPKDAEWSPSDYLVAFAEVTQARIEDLMKRAALFDGIVRAVKVGSGRDKARKGVTHGS